MHPEQNILVAAEVAELLRVDVQRVYTLRRRDPTFPTIRLGERQFRWDPEAVRVWLKNGGSLKGGNHAK